MAKLAVGPINKGLKTDRTAFNIDNDSFPTLINAYQWRGRIKRKRGTVLLGRLVRYFDSLDSAYTTFTDGLLDISGDGNLLTGANSFHLEENSSLVPGTIEITIVATAEVFTDPAADGVLVGSLGNSGTVNYASGAISIPSAAGLQFTATFSYYPGLPVMGIEELNLNPNVEPGTLAFDTTYAYNISGNSPYSINDVSFYKNPPTGTYPGYTEKTNWTGTWWNGEDYQQFWTVNYQGALWATNGVTVPFSPGSITSIGMQFNTITGIAIIGPGTPPASATITTGTNHGLVIGDFVFINEVVGVTGINFQTGYVTAVPAVNQITVEFPNATLAGAWISGGIVQYLTNRSDTSKDCIRWYDGDPTNGVVPPSFVALNGWVNFMPPLSQEPYSIADLPLAIYYLVGAKLIFPFKDRLLFIGPVVQTSSGNPIYLRDTVVYSQNGTPYYTVSYTNFDNPAIDTPASINNQYTPILVPENQTANPAAWFEDQIGFGGFISAGVSDTITSVSANEDVLIMGMTQLQTRFVYSGNDITPFDFYLINSELGTGSTFSTINMDEGIISRGSRGYIITSQVAAKRIDLEIPDQVFEINLQENGAERVTAQRDFINEWIYFTYRGDQSDVDFYTFPTQTLQFNYRDNSYAIFNECYTTYGPFRRKTGFTWATIPYAMWNQWNTPWNAGNSQLLQVEILGGNQQGFILFRDEGTGEGNSLYIQDIVGNLVTAPDHCLNNDDYIIIRDALGSVGYTVNDRIFSITTVDKDSFRLNPTINIVAGTYIGGGLITRMYVPFIQTKQFPQSWGMGRKTRIGPQQYLFTRTQGGQVIVLIYLSQNDNDHYNFGPVIPSPGSVNNALVYSQIVYTCPESTNMGLTPLNTNLAQLNLPGNISGPINSQNQIWHRVNTSLLGDTIQLGFTMSDTQMRDKDFSNQFTEIELHGFIVDVSSAGYLA